jgi:hypothetical protein
MMPAFLPFKPFAGEDADNKRNSRVNDMGRKKVGHGFSFSGFRQHDTAEAGLLACFT